MARTIILDGIKPGGINIFKPGSVSEAGEVYPVRVEANYSILSGTEVIKTLSRDITEKLSALKLATISKAYDDIFAKVREVELG